MKTHGHDVDTAPALHRANYPGTFAPDWWFGGKRFGWSLRYKKSKSFCNLIPEKGQTKVLLVFGRDEREKIEVESSKLIPEVKAAYEAAPTFHDGKWMALVVDSSAVLADVEFFVETEETTEQNAHTDDAWGRPPRSGKSPPDSRSPRACLSASGRHQGGSASLRALLRPGATGLRQAYGTAGKIAPLPSVAAEPR